MNCPGCNSKLKVWRVTHENTKTVRELTCTSCGGRFFTLEHFREVVNELAEEVIRLKAKPEPSLAPEFGAERIAFLEAEVSRLKSACYSCTKTAKREPIRGAF